MADVREFIRGKSNDGANGQGQEECAEFFHDCGGLRVVVRVFDARRMPCSNFSGREMSFATLRTPVWLGGDAGKPSAFRFQPQFLPMADIKFHCPECRQKIGVEGNAVGMKIDCPRCRSALVIPASAEAPVELLVRRRLVALAGSADSAYEEIESKRAELASALEEAATLRAESERSKSELERLRVERQGPQGSEEEWNRLRGIETEAKTELDQLRARLAAALVDREVFSQRFASIEPLRKDHSLAQAELARLRGELAALSPSASEARGRRTRNAGSRRQ